MPSITQRSITKRSITKRAQNHIEKNKDHGLIGAQAMMARPGITQRRRLTWDSERGSSGTIAVMWTVVRGGRRQHRAPGPLGWRRCGGWRRAEDGDGVGCSEAVQGQWRRCAVEGGGQRGPEVGGAQRATTSMNDLGKMTWKRAHGDSDYIYN